jgi:Uma2 family endonuclease
MKYKLVDEQGKAVVEPHIIRLQGWSEERYLKEAPVHAEFVKGEVIIMSPMSGEHSKIIKFLISLLNMYCEAKEIGEILPGPTIRLQTGIHREPDLCFIPKERSHLAVGMPLKTMPPFIIEVSHTTQKIDLIEKAKEYEEAGVEEYWVIDIENNAVHIHLLENGKYSIVQKKEERIASRIIPGLYIESSWLWQKPLPNAYNLESARAAPKANSFSAECTPVAP